MKQYPLVVINQGGDDNHSISRILDTSGNPVIIERDNGEVKRGWRSQHTESFSGFDFWEAGVRSTASVRLLPASILREIYSKSSAIKPAVDQISRQVAFSTWKIKSQQFMPSNYDITEAGIAATRFLRNPNRTDESFSQFIYKLIKDILILDTGVIEKVRDEDGKLIELYVRDAATFSVKTDKTGSYITSFEQKRPILEKNGQFTGKYHLKEFSPKDIIWIVFTPRSDSQYGYPTIETIVNEVAALLFTTKSVSKYFTHDEIPPGILILGDVAEAAFNRAKEWFTARKGEEGKRQIPIFSGVKDANWLPLQRPFREMQLAELSERLERIVFRNFGLSSLEMGMEQDINRSTSYSLERMSNSRLITPIREMLSFFITQNILSEIDPYIEFEYSHVAKGDLPTIASALVPLTGGPLLTINEGRELIGKEPIPGMDVMTQHSGAQTVGSNPEKNMLEKKAKTEVQRDFSEKEQLIEEISRAEEGVNKRDYVKEMKILKDALNSDLEREWKRIETEVINKVVKITTSKNRVELNRNIKELKEDIFNEDKLRRRFNVVKTQFMKSVELGDKRAFVQFAPDYTASKGFYSEAAQKEFNIFVEKLIVRVIKFSALNKDNFNRLYEAGRSFAGRKVSRQAAQEAISELIPYKNILDGLEDIGDFFV